MEQSIALFAQQITEVEQEIARTLAAGGAAKKVLKLPRQRELVTQLQVSERRACRVLQFPRATLRYRSVAQDQTPLRMRLRELAAARVRYGYRRLHVLLHREGWRVNHKRIYRLYRLEGLALRRRCRRKRASAMRVIPAQAQAPNERWSMDFVSDTLADGQRFRALTFVDNVRRVSPVIEVDRSITGQRVVAVLERLKAVQGVPKRIAVDNGPEFISKVLDAWAHENGVQLEFSRPGKPTDNAFIESFNGRLRQDCLNQHWFRSLEEARTIIEAWRQDYHANHPHSALGYVAPQVFAEHWCADEVPWSGARGEGTGGKLTLTQHPDPHLELKLSYRREGQMPKKGFTEEQIVYALRQAEAGTPVLEVCRKLGVTEQTFYRWKRKFAGLGMAELRKLRQLEEENRKLKQLVADLTLDKHMLQEVLQKKF